MEKTGVWRKLRQGVEKYAPVVAQLLDDEETLAVYSRRLSDYQSAPEYGPAQKRIATFVTQKIEQLFSQKINLPSSLAINIVDHHAVMTHPILTGTNIIAQAHQLLATGPKTPAVAFSSAIVPVNNYLNKKGFHLGGKQISLFADKEIHQASYFMEKRKMNFCDRLQQNKRWTEFTPERRSFLQEIESKFLDLDYSAAENYIDQVSLINHEIWQWLFAPEVRPDLPPLFQVASEDILRTLLPAELADPQSLLGKLFVDGEYCKQVLAEFKGIVGCWGGEKGTHFFWWRDEKNRPERLELAGEELVSAFGTGRLAFTPTAITTGLKERRIIPSMFVIYTFLVFSSGVKPLGGYGSSTYITKMKQAWLHLLGPETEVGKRLKV